MPSSTGIPAITSAPNATSRMTRVIGRLRSVALARSLFSQLVKSCWMEAEPTSSTRRPGWSACAADTTRWIGASRSAALSVVVSSRAGTSTAVPSAERVTGPTESTIGSLRSLPAICRAVEVAAAWSKVRPGRAVSRTFSVAAST